MSALPHLFRGSRRAPMQRLLALGLAQGVAAFATVHLLGQLALGRANVWLLLGLAGAALALGVLHVLEVIEAERLGQAYTRALRRRLLEHLWGAGSAALSQFGRGGLWLRLTSDLNGLRQWISLGVARLVCALPMLLALVVSLAFTQPPLAAVALFVLGVLAGLAAALRAALRRRETELRRARGRLAGQVDRALTRLATDAHPQAGDRTLTTLRRRGREVERTAIARARLHGLLRGSAQFLALGTTVAAMAWTLHTVPDARDGAASALALLALLAAPLRDLERAWEMRQSYVVAGSNLRRVFDLAAAPDDALRSLSIRPQEPPARGLLKTAIPTR